MRHAKIFELNYFKAQALLKKRDSKKLCNNTYLKRLDDCIAVLLHCTYIIKYYPDGRIVLNTNGWETVTTKDRLNGFLGWPFGICTISGRWFLRCRDGIYLYEDHMEIDKDGFPNTQPLPCFQLGELTGDDYENMDEFYAGLKELSMDQIKRAIRGVRKYDVMQEHIALYREDALIQIIEGLDVQKIGRMLRYCHDEIAKVIIKNCDETQLPLLINRVSEVCDQAIEQRLRRAA